MNELDIAIITIIVLSAFFGLWRGLVREVLSLLTWIAALVIAGIYSEKMAPMLAAITANPTIQYVASFALLFIITMILGTVLNGFLAKLINVSGLKFADRILGAAFGVLRGLVIVMVAIMLSSNFVADTRLWQQSQLVPYSLDLIEWSRVFIVDYSSVNAAWGS